MQKNKIDILNKPNQTIMISHKDLTLTQKKVYNVILKEAKEQLKQNKSQIYFYFNYEDLKERAGINATDNLHLKHDLEVLADMTIETVKDKRNWGFFKLLSSVKREENELRIEIPGPIREAIIENSYYTALDLIIIKDLKSKYAVILYEIAMRYNKVEIPRFTIEEFKKITGTENYDNFNNLRKYCIDPAIKEINEKTDITLDYTTSKIGKKVMFIKFHTELKDTSNPKKTDIHNENLEFRTRDSLELWNALPELEKTESRKKELFYLLAKHSFVMLKADIEYCILKKPKDFWAYFIKSISSGHYGKEILEKRKLDEEAKQRAKEKEFFDDKESKTREESREKLIEKKIKNLSEDELENFEFEFEKTKKRMPFIQFSREVFLKEWVYLEFFRS